MERLQRKVARFLEKAKLFCIYLHRGEGDNVDGVDKAKIFATAYTGISPRFH